VNHRYCLWILSAAVIVYGGVDTTLLKPGSEAPSFSLPTLEPGKREVLSVWCGEKLSKPYVNSTPHIVILSFWATFCKPCQKEIPILMKFAEKHKDDKLRIFLISLDKEGKSKVKPFVEKKKFTLPVLLDPYSRTAERYGVKALPALFVIDSKGMIVYSSSGYDEKKPFESTLEEIVTAIKEGKDVEHKEVEVSGESVAAPEKDAGDSAVAEDEGLEKAMSPKQKWRAIVRVECGESITEVAEDMGVDKADIKVWFDELKDAAMLMWGDPSSPQKDQ
jgi:peroxiredoxin